MNNPYAMPLFHLTYPCPFLKLSLRPFALRKNCALTVSLHCLNEWSVTLIFPIGHLRVPYRFTHFLPIDSQYPPIRAVVPTVKWDASLHVCNFLLPQSPHSVQLYEGVTDV